LSAEVTFLDFVAIATVTVAKVRGQGRQAGTYFTKFLVVIGLLSQTNDKAWIDILNETSDMYH
jgi:hypothetical protein